MNILCGARKIEQLQDSARGAEIIDKVKGEMHLGI